MEIFGVLMGFHTAPVVCVCLSLANLFVWLPSYCISQDELGYAVVKSSSKNLSGLKQQRSLLCSHCVRSVVSFCSLFRTQANRVATVWNTAGCRAREGTVNQSVYFLLSFPLARTHLLTFHWLHLTSDGQRNPMCPEESAQPTGE